MEPICKIRDIYRELYRFEKTFSSAYNITLNEAMLLCCMKDGKERTAGELCEFIGLSKSRVSKVITAVEEKGFISRKSDEADRRTMLFSLTTDGRKKIEAMMHTALNFQEFFDSVKSCIDKP